MPFLPNIRAGVVASPDTFLSCAKAFAAAFCGMLDTGVEAITTPSAARAEVSALPASALGLVGFLLTFFLDRCQRPNGAADRAKVNEITRGSGAHPLSHKPTSETALRKIVYSAVGPAAIQLVTL